MLVPSRRTLLLSILHAIMLVSCMGSHTSRVVDYLKKESDTSSLSESSQAIVKAAQQHRESIRRNLGVGDKADGAKWLDAMIGFPNDASRKYLEWKLYNAVNQGKLTVAMMGISTTAGHDNHYNQSFSKVFERHFGTVLAAGGVKIEVRNHAVGGFGVMPSHHCVHSIVGTDMDILGWDYQMMAPRADCIVEHFARAAMHMPTQPALLWWQGGVWLPQEGKFDPKSVKPVRSNLKQSCANKWIVDSYSAMGSHYGDLAAVLNYLRYLGDVSYLKDGTDPLFADPEKGSLPRPDFDEPARPWGHRRLARHHPGPTLHRVWGLVWSHAYLGILMHALAHGDTIPRPATVEIPVVGCQAKLCDRVVPTCATDMLPRASDAPGLSTLAKPGHSWEVVDVDNRKAEMDHFGYVDLKVGMTGSSNDGELTLQFTTSHDDMPISICQIPCPWGRCKKGRVLLEGNVDYKLDGSPLNMKDAPTVDNPGHFKPLLQKDMCYVIAKSVSKGRHELTLRVTAPSGGAVVVSHLIYY